MIFERRKMRTQLLPVYWVLTHFIRRKHKYHLCLYFRFLPFSTFVTEHINPRYFIHLTNFLSQILKQLFMLDTFPLIFCILIKMEFKQQFVNFCLHVIDSCWELLWYSYFRYFKSLEEEIEKSTQNSSIFDVPEVKDAYIKFVSQNERPSTPFPEKGTQHEKLQWLYKHRNTGVYVLCDKCNKMRYLEYIVDPVELPKKWYCSMNAGKYIFSKHWIWIKNYVFFCTLLL